MSACKTPNYLTGKRGRRWVHSLRAAEDAGARIVVEATGVRVTFNRTNRSPFQSRPWVDRKGNRYDSYDCVPYFKP